jgi:hypothetical protein
MGVDLQGFQPQVTPVTRIFLLYYTKKCVTAVTARY